MHAPINIVHSMVDHLMGVLAFKAIVGEQCISVERGTSFDMFADFGLKSFLFPVRNDGGSDLAATLQDSHNSGLVFCACPSDATLPLVDMHDRRFAADEGFIGFDFAGEQTKSAIFERIANPVIH